MPTAVLDLILKSNLGKSIFTWFFIALAGANVAQWIDRRRQDAELAKCNAERVADNKQHEAEKAEIVKAHITTLEKVISRIENVEKKYIKR